MPSRPTRHAPPPSEPTVLVLEAEPELADDARAAAFERLSGWVEAHHARTLGLPPGEVIAEVSRGHTLRGRVAGGASAVGMFLVADRRRYPGAGLADEYRVLVALGTAADDVDDAGWAGRLETLIHELFHVGEFYAATGLPPAAAVAAGTFERWQRFQAEHPETHEADDPCERTARRLVNAYLRECPEEARMPDAPARRRRR